MTLALLICHLSCIASTCASTAAHVTLHVRAHLPTMPSCFPRLAMWKKYLSVFLSLLVSNVTFNPKVEVLVGMS